ncbi:quinate permease [Lipomyces arxii]|uniref:quinate permease n=1 Tax=Lipomyces arxii TaxID=56418 RepID=UPI0034D00917
MKIFDKLVPSATKLDPPQIYNRKLAFAVFSAAMTGSLFGFDTGNIGGIIVLDSFKHTFGLNVDGPNAYQAPTLSANIVTTLQAGCILGAATVGWCADKFGRQKVMLFHGVLFLFGVALQCIANLSTLYAGRVFSGIATGACSVLGPMYISENAPKNLRGSLAVCFNMTILVCLTIAFWINYGVSKWTGPLTDAQWRVPMAMQFVPGGVLVLGMLFQKESPRFLVRKNKLDEAKSVLCRIRQLPEDHDYIKIEFAEMVTQVNEELEAVGTKSAFALMQEVYKTPSIRRRYLLSVSLQIFQQTTGTNAINYYASSIFASVGVSGTSQSLFTTGIYGIVKVVTTAVYVLFIVDRVGRRKPLMAGSIIQAISLLYLAIFVKVKNPQPHDAMSGGGYVAVLFIYIYAFGWSFGLSPIPWLVASEIFPTRVRGFCMSSTLALQWLFNFAITRATPYMMLNMDKWGAYLFFSLCTFISVVWTFFFFPELKGRSLESMDDLFEHKWSEMRKYAYPKANETIRRDVALSTIDMAKLDTKHVEEI